MLCKVYAERGNEKRGRPYLLLGEHGHKARTRDGAQRTETWGFSKKPPHKHGGNALAFCESVFHQVPLVGWEAPGPLRLSPRRAAPRGQPRGAAGAAASALPAARLLPRWRRPRPARAVSRSPSPGGGGVYDRGGAGRGRRGWRRPGAGAGAGAGGRRVSSAGPAAVPRRQGVRPPGPVGGGWGKLFLAEPLRRRGSGRFSAAMLGAGGCLAGKELARQEAAPGSAGGRPCGAVPPRGRGAAGRPRGAAPLPAGREAAGREGPGEARGGGRGRACPARGAEGVAGPRKPARLREGGGRGGARTAAAAPRRYISAWKSPTRDWRRGPGGGGRSSWGGGTGRGGGRFLPRRAPRGSPLPQPSPAVAFAPRLKLLVVLGASRLKRLDAVVKKNNPQNTKQRSPERCGCEHEVLFFFFFFPVKLGYFGEERDQSA